MLELIVYSLTTLLITVTTVTIYEDLNEYEDLNVY
jgi:hypothetical protein